MAQLARRVLGILPVVLLAVGACAPSADEDLYGVTLEVESRQPFVYAPDFRARLHRLLEASCAHVGIDPTRLWGTRLRIVDGGVSCAGYEVARGCTRDGGAQIDVSTLAWYTGAPAVGCVEDTPLPHEILHLRIGDPEHEDPRWRSAEYWRPLRQALESDGCSGAPPALIW
jgi:hypothetical protein